MGKKRRRKVRGFDKPVPEAPDGRPQLVIGLPMYGQPPSEAWMCFIELCKNLTDHGDRNFRFDIISTNQAYVDFARNQIVERAARKGAKEILFLDQDVLYPPDIYWKLAAHDVPVVSALYFKRLPPYEPLVFDFVGRENVSVTHRYDYEEGLVECGAVGMGATLLKLDAIDKVVKWQIDHGDTNPNPFRVHPPIGEDIFFCAHCREADIPVYCDTSVKCLHVGVNPVSEADFRLARNYGSSQAAWKRLQELDREKAS